MAKGIYEEWLEEDNLLKLEAWARNGLSYEEIAHNIGINVVTLREWRKRFPTIDTALKKQKEVVDTIVENALFKRACGYSVKETKETFDADGNLVEKVVITKELPADTTAQIFYLKNRKPNEWRDKREQVVNTDLGSDEAEKLGELLRNAKSKLR